MAKSPIVSFAVSEKMKVELDTIAAKRHIPVSELIRDYIDKGMNIDKTVSDIDFIRRQIREELGVMLKPQINRLAKLLMRIGIMSISLCYFNSKLVHIFAPVRDRTSYEELMAECKHNAAAYLNMRDATLDAAFREFDENNS
ncbi:MAG: ribbon-helix-helix protein, CopG family [Gracilibacteraceae bacterium]|jgi:hypothetical protein|nr:ribbon-helix-helix protein, CopG family [Gracilibacteraceae bacterium]